MACIVVQTMGKKPVSSAKSRSSNGVQPVVDVNATLADKHDAQGAGRKRFDSIQKDRALTAVVLKCIRDNFTGFSEQEVHHVKVDGQSLHEKLLSDKRLAGEKSKLAPKFGKVYFANLRKQYERQSQGDGALDVLDDTLPISPLLFAAVDASRAAVPSRDKLVQYCQVTQVIPNQSEVVGLFLHGLELKPWLGGSHVAALLEITRLIKRFNLQNAFKDEFSAFSDQVDRTLMQVYSAMKSKGFKLCQFMETYRSECELLLPVASVDRLMLVTGSWAGHEADITLVVTSSALGKKMFQFAADVNLSHSIGKVMDDVLKNVLGIEDPLTAAMVIDARTQIQKELEDRGAFTTLDRTRVIEVSYNGADLKLKVSSVLEEVNIRVATFLKREGLRSLDVGGQQLVDPLFCEDGLLLDVRVKRPRVIAAEVLRSFQSARKTANAQLSAVRQEVGEHVKEPVVTIMLLMLT